jgi:Holliday junction resolvase RusA-like endonuclease
MKIIIEGDPIPRQRQRCACLNGRGHSYTKTEHRKEMDNVRKHILTAWNDIFNNPSSQYAQECALFAPGSTFLINLYFYLPLIKSDTIALKNLKLWGIISCTEKPDFDNLAKLYTDCATDIIWKDDKQIIKATAWKVKYSENPRTEMEIMTKKELNITDDRLKVFKLFSPSELRQMLEDCYYLGTVLRNTPEAFNDNENIGSEDFFNFCSREVIDFSMKYADQLKKLAKVA